MGFFEKPNNGFWWQVWGEGSSGRSKMCLGVNAFCRICLESTTNNAGATVVAVIGVRIITPMMCAKQSLGKNQDAPRLFF